MISWLIAAVRAYKTVFAKASFPLRIKALRIFPAAFSHRKDVGPLFAGGNGGSSLGQEVMRPRIEALGLLIWPYICSNWSVTKRLSVLQAHYREIQEISPLQLDLIHQYVIFAFTGPAEEVVLVVDRPRWLMREGELCLSLFQGETRLFSLTFALGRNRLGRIAYIGGIQGRRSEDIAERYRELERELENIRPRDLLVNCFQILCLHLGVAKILAISESHRYFRHPYFGDKKIIEGHLDYDMVWGERGFKPSGGEFMELVPTNCSRDLDLVPTRKRAQYRRRNDLYEQVGFALRDFLSGNKPALVKSLKD